MRAACLWLHLFACATIVEALTSHTNSHIGSSAPESHIEVWPTYIKHIAAETPTGRWPGAKLAVCIVGQLSRLETQSKIENLFKQQTLGLDVFVVAEVGADFYVNLDSAPQDRICHADFGTPTEVEERMSPFYRAGLYIKPSSQDVAVNLTNWPRYGRDKPWINASKRLWGHMNQWTHLRQCAELIKEQEKRTGRQYKAIMKIRDNGIVTKPMTISAEEAVVVKKCSSWGGVNDKALIAPRKYLHQVFERPIEIAVQANNGEDLGTVNLASVLNPEQFLHTVYNHDGVKLEEVQSDTITVVDGRCSGAVGLPDDRHRTWCLVEDWKDCHPAEVGGYRNCRGQQQYYQH